VSELRTALIVRRAGVFWTGGARDIFSMGIRYFTRPGLSPFRWAEATHMGLRFQLFGGTSERIHEALASEGYCEKDGLKLVHFVLKSPRHVCYTFWLPVPCGVAQDLYDESKALLGKPSYARDQIYAFILMRLWLTRWLPLTLKDDPSRVICSEIATRLVHETCDRWYDFRKPGVTYDGTAPQDAFDVARCKYVESNHLGEWTVMDELGERVWAPAGGDRHA